METQSKTVTLNDLKSQMQPTTEKYEVGFTNSQSFELMQRGAKLLSSSTLVPKDYQNNLPNCVVALNMANRMGADPLMVMQNLYVVYGKPSWSSKFLIASINICGRFSALRFEFVGDLVLDKEGKALTDELGNAIIHQDNDNWGCRAWAIDKATGQKLVGPKITIGLAKVEGWYNKSGSKWKTIPEKMLMYRAGGWWADLYAPEITMGFRTVEENMDIIDIDKDGNILDPNPAPVTTQELKRERKDVTNNTPPTETVTDPETGEVTSVNNQPKQDELLQEDDIDPAIKAKADEFYDKKSKGE